MEYHDDPFILLPERLVGHPSEARPLYGEAAWFTTLTSKVNDYGKD